MKRAYLLLLLLFGACGDNGADDDVAPDAGPDAAPGDIAEQLAALDGVTVTETFPEFGLPDYRYFDLWFTEPLDHDDPGADTFQLYAALIHKDVGEPLVVYTGGYDAGFRVWQTEPAQLLESNQISLEYRFYGQSQPDTVPWSLLRVEQFAADEHDVLTKLATIYHGNTIGTGGSKGGEHAMQYAKLHPEDMDGVVAYVAPVITDIPDLRYDGITDRIGTDTCRAAVRAIARRTMEQHAAMETFASTTASFAVAGVAHATETAIVEEEFGYWMTRGIGDCGSVPDAATASDAALWAFLEDTGPPAGYSDEELAVAGTQYIYQDMVQLGYPIWNHAYLDDLLAFSYEDWSAYLPAGEPIAYDPTEPRALADWIEHDAERIMMINGEWDPWGAGYPPIAPGRDAYAFTTPQGSHWSSGIYSLPTDQQSAAIEALRRWAGVGDRAMQVRPPVMPMGSNGRLLEK
jgi:pimeloyl-ACP methyl ester carboxylesterase